MNNGTKQPHIPIPSMAMRKGGAGRAGGGGGGGHGGGGGRGSKYLCVCFCENRPKSYVSLFFGQKSAIHIFNIVSGRQVSVAQAKKWKDAWESTTWPTLNPKWAKSFKSGNSALRQIRYFQSTQASMLLI